MKKSDLVEFIEKTYRSWYHSTSTPVFEVLADALIREGYVVVEKEPPTVLDELERWAEDRLRGQTGAYGGLSTYGIVMQEVLSKLRQLRKHD